MTAIDASGRERSRESIGIYSLGLRWLVCEHLSKFALNFLLSSRTPPLRISLALLLITNTCGSLRVTITKSRKIKIHGPPHPYRTSLCKHTLPLLSSLSHLHGPFGVVPILSGDGEPLFVISICGTPFCFFEGD